MRIAVWVLVGVMVGAIAFADAPTGTVVISCNETDAELIVDGILIPDRTPAVLVLPTGSHVIEARKPPLIAQKKTIEVLGQQQVKVRFDLMPPAPPPPLPPLDSLGSGSGSGSGVGSAVGSGSASVAPPPPPPAPPPPEHHCRQGGHEVPCPPEGPHCTQGGRLVSCATGRPLPPPGPPVRPGTAVATGSGSTIGPGGPGGPGAPGEPRPPVGPTNLEIATNVPHAIAYVDGVPVQSAPCALELEAGEHVIAVYAPGMIPAESIFKVDDAHRQRIELDPTEPRKRIDVPAK